MALASVRAPRSGAYILQDVCEFEQELDVGLLRQAWESVARGHAALRTRLDCNSSGMLRPAVEEDARVRWHAADSVDLAAYLRDDRERGFDLGDGVPLRVAVIRNGPRSWAVVLTIHHALVDGRSLLIVWREWMRAYDALVSGEKPESTLEYREETEDVIPAGADLYWRESLTGITQTTDYIADRLLRMPVPVGSGFEKESLILSAECSEEVGKLAERHGVTINNLVLGAYTLLLSRYSGREDVVFGVTRTGRGASSRLSNQVGMYIHTLPFRLKAPSDVLPAPWLRHIREQWVEQRRYERTPLENIAEWSGLPPATRLFDTVVVYDHEPPGETLRKLGGGWERRKLYRLQRTDSPLTLVAYGRPAVRLEFVYDARRFARETVAGMVRHLGNLLTAFVEQPDSVLGRLKMVAGTEETRLVEEMNRTKTEYPQELCIHELFEEQVRLRPEKAALDTPAKSISYSDLNARANRLAWHLRDKGIGSEDVVAVCLPRSPEAVIAVLGALKAGAAFLPLDTSLPEERLASMLADAGVKLVISGSTLPRVGELEGIPRVSLDDVADGPRENLTKATSSAAPAYAIFTSGSTGRPKAVVVTHRNLVNYTLAARQVYGLSESDRRLQFASLGTDLFVAEVFNYLCCGATLVLGLERRDLSIREFVRVLDDQRITVTGLPSTWWNEWVEAMRNGVALPSCLRAVIAGMEQVNAAALLEWRRMTAGRVRWFNAYGPTETTCTSAIYESGSSEWEGDSCVPIGKPIANTRAYVLDHLGNVVPVGVTGELYIGGDGVALGYRNDSGEMERQFVPDPFSDEPGSRMYRTGDLVFRLPDGNLVFQGRADRQVKIRGYRIELEEVEAVLSEHPGVRQCAVVADGAQGQERLLAYLTSAEKQEPGRAALRLHLARRLPEYMIPARFVTLAEMPRTSSGKIDRQALQRYGEPQLSQQHIRPDNLRDIGNETEEQLARLWEEALKVGRVELTDDFFTLGGDSLSATRLITSINARFKTEIVLEDLLRAPTVARMALALGGDSCSRTIALQPEGANIPLFCITTTVNGPGCFRRLAQLLGNNQPFLVAPRLVPDGEALEQTAERIGKLADEFVSAVRELRPRGPYILGGYCLGGIVAFETARRLEDAGAEVRLVILFDAPTPGYPKLSPVRTHYLRRLRRFISGEAINWKEVFPHFATVARLLRRKALAAYAPQPMTADVVQFIAGEEPISAQVLDDARLGWRDLCQGRFMVYRVKGAHQTMFLEPNVPALAATLSEILREVNHQGSKPSPDGLTAR